MNAAAAAAGVQRTPSMGHSGPGAATAAATSAGRLQRTEGPPPFNFLKELFYGMEDLMVEMQEALAAGGFQGSHKRIIERGVEGTPGAWGAEQES